MTTNTITTRTTTYTSSTTQSSETDETQGSSAGSGVFRDDGSVPDAPSYSLQLSNLLSKFSPKLKDDFEVRLAAITEKMKEVNADVQTESVVANQEIQQLNQEENAKKMEDSIREMEKAAEANKKKSFWDDFGLVGSIVNIALTVAVAAVAVAVLGPVGVGLACMMLASAVTQSIALIDAAVMEANGGKGILALALDGLDKACGGDGLSEQQIANCAIASAVMNAVIGITLAVMSGRATGALDAIKSIEVAMKIVQIASATVDVAGSVTTAVGQVGSALTTLEAAEHTANAKDIDAEVLANQALIASLDAMIEEALAQLIAASDVYNQMMDDVVGLLNETGDTMANTRMGAV